MVDVDQRPTMDLILKDIRSEYARLLNADATLEDVWLVSLWIMDIQKELRRMLVT